MMDARWTGLFALACVACDSDNVLRGRTPVEAFDVDNAARLTDGVAAFVGDAWESQLTARLRGHRSRVTYDLGAETSIAALWLQGDHNDEYTVEISVDGATFVPLWRAERAPGGGLQDRSASGLNAKGRYLRVRASTGDDAYSLSELQVFTTTPDPFPPDVTRRHAARLDVERRTVVLLFGLALLVFALASYRGAPRWWIALLGVAPVIAGIDALATFAESWPADQRSISLVRGTIGFVAALTIAREVFAGPRLAAHRGATLTTLATTGVLGLLSFYNLGEPQFWDRDLRRSTYVHQFDLRQYYAIAKYFPEIGYREIYAADVAAYLDDHPRVAFDRLAALRMRDLSNHQDSTIGAQRARIEAVRTRFTPARWEAYKIDQRYFRRAVGDEAYFETMNDMGGNATPVWIGIAHLLFNALDASNAAFELTALLDPLLLLAALIAIGLTFGPRTACVCMVLFGANDLIMFGNNWGGATLRHDWMAYLAFGACALRRQRWALAGCFLAMAALIRAFPALALVALGLPVFWHLVESMIADRRLPSIAELRDRHRPILRIALGASITVVLAVTASSALLGLDAWPDWYSKVSQLTADPHANHISLRSLIAGSDNDQQQVLRDRLPLLVVATAFYVGAVMLIARGQRLEQIAMLGLVLVPVLFYPANYYLHCLWLLPMVAIERRGSSPEPSPLAPDEAVTWLALLGLCAMQYWTTLVKDLPLHFYLAHACLFAALTVMLGALARTRLRNVNRAQA